MKRADIFAGLLVKITRLPEEEKAQIGPDL